MPEFPSEEWLAEYVERINDSPSYKEAAATWEGNVAYFIEAEPDRGLEEDVWRGSISGMGSAAAERSAMTGEGRAIIRKLTKGELKVKGLSRHPGAVSRLNRLLSVR
jgi:hypothetical protein